MHIDSTSYQMQNEIDTLLSEFQTQELKRCQMLMDTYGNSLSLEHYVYISRSYSLVEEVERVSENLQKITAVQNALSIGIAAYSHDAGPETNTIPTSSIPNPVPDPVPGPVGPPSNVGPPIPVPSPVPVPTPVPVPVPTPVPVPVPAPTSPQSLPLYNLISNLHLAVDLLRRENIPVTLQETFLKGKPPANAGFQGALIAMNALLSQTPEKLKDLHMVVQLTLIGLKHCKQMMMENIKEKINAHQEATTIQFGSTF